MNLSILLHMNESIQYFVLVYLTPFIQHNVFEAHPCCSMCQSVTTFIARITSHCQYIHKAFLVARWQRIHPSVLETRVLSLGWEDPLGKKMATHSSGLAWEIPWTKEPGGLQSMGSQRVGHGLVTKQQIYHALLISSSVDGHLHCSFRLTLL